MDLIDKIKKHCIEKDYNFFIWVSDSEGIKSVVDKKGGSILESHVIYEWIWDSLNKSLEELERLLIGDNFYN